MKQNDWTSKLHERLDGHKATVPDGLWDKIATRLDDDNTATPAPHVNTPSRPKTARIVAMALSAAASVAVVVTVALRMNDDTINNVAHKFDRPAASLHNPAPSSVVNAPQRLMALRLHPSRWHKHRRRQCCWLKPHRYLWILHIAPYARLQPTTCKP